MISSNQTVDPFELYPESEPLKKKLNSTVTLQQVREIIQERMIQIRTEQTPRWGYDKHYVTAVLTGLIIELEEKCQYN